MGGAALQVHQQISAKLSEMVSVSRKFDEFLEFRPKKFMIRYRNKFEDDGHTAWYYTHRSGVAYDDPMNLITEANAAALNNARRKLPNARPIPKAKGVIKGYFKANTVETHEWADGHTQLLDRIGRYPWITTGLASPDLSTNVKFYAKSLHLPGMQNLDYENEETVLEDPDQKPTNQLIQEVIFDMYCIVEFRHSKPKGTI